MANLDNTRYKVAVAIFTYGDDAALIQQSMPQLQSLAADLDVHVFDDARHPLSQVNREWVERRAKYSQTDFNRNHNLNGSDCIIGMLTAMWKACQESRAVGVIKLDSDTLLTSTEWVNVSYQAVGFEVIPLRFSGLCYFLSLDAIVRLLEYFTKRVGTYAPDYEAHLPEDQTISLAAFYLGLTPLMYNWNRGLVGGYSLNQEYPDSHYRKCQVLSFGQRSSANPDRVRELMGTGLTDIQARKVLVAQAMERYRNQPTVRMR